MINDDGGKVSKEITIMSPDSDPVITSIDPKNKGRKIDGNNIVDYVPENQDEYSEVLLCTLDGEPS